MRVSDRRTPLRRARWRAARYLGIVAATAVALGAMPVPVRAQGEALTLAEVLDLRRRGVSTRRILQTAQDYCVAFAVTDSVEQELVASGADSALVGGIRQSCVVRPPVQLPTGVLLDDDFKVLSTLGRFTAVDRLCSVRPDSGGMRLENQRRQRGCSISYPFQLADANVRVELTVAELDGDPGAAAALTLGTGVAAGDQYTFSITTQSRFELCATVGEQCRRVLSDTRAGLVRPGTQSENRIAVEIAGREINLFVNDDRVATYVAERPVAGSISVAVGPRTTAVFSRLRIRRTDAAEAAGDRASR
jgi:hypothetical protein